MVKKRLTELELSLLHVQQDTEIPAIQLPVHPQVQSVLDAASKDQVSASPMTLGTLLQDSSFLNVLQGNVNVWIKEIQKVTGLTRDAAIGSASQEISFWLAMETALGHIEEQLQSPPITYTLDVLKQAKRYHATVSFLADTGIKEAVDRVQKYNLIMKVVLFV